jgi:hypothetical protein
MADNVRREFNGERQHFITIMRPTSVKKIAYEEGYTLEYVAESFSLQIL